VDLQTSILAGAILAFFATPFLASSAKFAKVLLYVTLALVAVIGIVIIYRLNAGSATPEAIASFWPVAGLLVLQAVVSAWLSTCVTSIALRRIQWLG
jgi:hypothetical protein